MRGWISSLLDGSKTGADVAGGFILGQELVNRRLADEAFLDMLYDALFDSQPNSRHYSYWLDRLRKDAPRIGVFYSFIYSKEFDVLCDEYDIPAFPRTDPVEFFVTRLYRLCLFREPDREGLEYWISSLKDASQIGADIAHGLLFSQEFLSFDTSDEEFLNILYHALFNRAPDRDGYLYWLKKLNNNVSRKEVLDGFANAVEFKNFCWEYQITPNLIAAFVIRCYQQCLNREPDRGGLDYWVNSLLEGSRNGADAARGFIFSPEFINRTTTNLQFLTILYTAFFNRNPDDGGFNYWLNKLNKGTGREKVLNDFVNAQEFDNLCEQCGITSN